MHVPLNHLRISSTTHYKHYSNYIKFVAIFVNESFFVLSQFLFYLYAFRRSNLTFKKPLVLRAIIMTLTNNLVIQHKLCGFDSQYLGVIKADNLHHLHNNERSSNLIRKKVTAWINYYVSRTSWICGECIHFFLRSAKVFPLWGTPKNLIKEFLIQGLLCSSLI